MFFQKIRASLRRGRMVIFIGLVGAATSLASPSVAAADISAPSAAHGTAATSVPCGTWVRAYAPYLDGDRRRVNGTYNNCQGRMTRVCLSLQFYRIVFPGGGEWIWVGSTCINPGHDPWDTTFGVREAGPSTGYGQYVGTIIGYDGAGNQIASHVGPVAAV